MIAPVASVFHWPEVVLTGSRTQPRAIAEPSVALHWHSLVQAGHDQLVELSNAAHAPSDASLKDELVVEPEPPPALEGDSAVTSSSE